MAVPRMSAGGAVPCRRELLLAGNPLGEGGGVWLERLAQANDALQRLSLEGCGVSDLTSRNVTYCLALARPPLQFVFGGVPLSGCAGNCWDLEAI